MPTRRSRTTPSVPASSKEALTNSDSDGTRRSRLEIYDLKKETRDFQDKQFLIPFGEYMPIYTRAFMTAVGRGEEYAGVIPRLDRRPGYNTRPLAAGSALVGVLFCNEVTSPTLYRSLAEEGAGVFINIASHGWFHGSYIVAQQMRSVAIVRAVESRRWYVQASDVAPSFVLDPYGRVAITSAWGLTGSVEATVEIRHDQTPYVRFGPWVIWLAVAWLLIMFIRSRERV